MAYCTPEITNPKKLLWIFLLKQVPIINPCDVPAHLPGGVAGKLISKGFFFPLPAANRRLKRTSIRRSYIYIYMYDYYLFFFKQTRLPSSPSAATPPKWPGDALRRRLLSLLSSPSDEAASPLPPPLFLSLPPLPPSPPCQLSWQPLHPLLLSCYVYRR